MLDILLECRGDGGKIHLASHLEAEEVAVEIDAFLHQLVVNDRGVKAFHIQLALTVPESETVDGQRAFGVVEVVEASGVGGDGS